VISGRVVPHLSGVIVDSPKREIMKNTIKLLSAMAFVFSTTSSMAFGKQDTVLTEGTVKLYSSTSDFRNKETTLEVQAGFRYRELGFSIVGLSVITDKEDRKKAGRVFGLELGDKVYVNPGRRQLKQRNNFFEAQLIGPYIHYKVVEGGNTPNGQAPFIYPAEKLLHLETGKIRTLTTKRFRKLSKDDPELLLRFQQEKHKNRVLTLYLKEYFERKKK
jgi:hypothetical protein